MMRLDRSTIAAVVMLSLAALTSSGVTAQGAAPQPVPALNGVPVFQADPKWPILPQDWTWGQVIGIFADSRGHVWTANRSRITEWDPQGKLVQSWDARGPDGNWSTIHGMFVDHNGFVWTNARESNLTVKFTKVGRVVMTIGRYNETGGSNDTTLMGRPSEIWVDPADNEVFIADGYRNRRVIVFDGATGKYLRHWGAYGEKPDDAERFDPKTMVTGALPKQFSTPHGITGSKDGKIYVADRRGNRIQVFDHQGKFLAEKIIAPKTLASGSAFVIVLSPDPQEQWLYLADGTNHKVWILRRADLEVVGEFGHGGRQVGQMLRPHGMSVDAQGNLYVGEASTGRRVQKFTVSR